MKAPIRALIGNLRGNLGDPSGSGIAARLRGLRQSVFIATGPLLARWQLLDARVQRMALIGLAVLALAILWAYVWLPATRGRAMLAERIPLMSAQLATMRSQAEEIRRINSLPPVVATRTALPLADVAGLQALFGANAKVSAADNRAFRIVIPAIAYTAWLDQLDNALGRYRLRIGEIKLQSLAAADARGKPAEVAVDFSLVDDSGPQAAR